MPDLGKKQYSTVRNKCSEDRSCPRATRPSSPLTPPPPRAPSLLISPTAVPDFHLVGRVGEVEQRLRIHQACAADEDSFVLKHLLVPGAGHGNNDSETSIEHAEKIEDRYRSRRMIPALNHVVDIEDHLPEIPSPNIFCHN